MRKIIKMGLAVMTVMSMSMVAMAAPSISSTYEVSTVVDDNGNEVDLIVSASETKITAAEAVALLELDDDAESELAIVVQEISLSDGATEDDFEWPLDITLAVNGVTAESGVRILHYVDGAWQVEKLLEVGDNYVTFEINSLSPVAVVVSGSSTLSPQTGEMNTAPIIMMAVVALAGVYLVSKRKVA